MYSNWCHWWNNREERTWDSKSDNGCSGGPIPGLRGTTQSQYWTDQKWNAFGKLIKAYHHCKSSIQWFN